MFRVFLITFGPFIFFIYSIPASAQVAAEEGYFIQRFIRAKDEATYNTNGSVIGLKYAEIAGTPFLNNDYTLAELYKGERKAATAPIKINLFTNEIYFLKEGQELVLEEQGINKIRFLKAGDTTSFIRRVPYMFLNKKKVDDFVQVMNIGRYQLLKYSKKDIVSADSAMNYKRYFFSETNHYFLKNREKIERIKKLDDKNVLSYLPQSNTFHEWIKANHIDFKKEKDVILFLNYYNATISK
jgi:hypothetical protein